MLKLCVQVPNDEDTKNCPNDCDPISRIEIKFKFEL